MWIILPRRGDFHTRCESNSLRISYSSPSPARSLYYRSGSSICFQSVLIDLFAENISDDEIYTFTSECAWETLNWSVERGERTGELMSNDKGFVPMRKRVDLCSFQFWNLIQFNLLYISSYFTYIQSATLLALLINLLSFSNKYVLMQKIYIWYYGFLNTNVTPIWIWVRTFINRYIPFLKYKTKYIDGDGATLNVLPTKLIKYFHISS